MNIIPLIRNSFEEFYNLFELDLQEYSSEDLIGIMDVAEGFIVERASTRSIPVPEKHRLRQILDGKPNSIHR